MISIQCECGVGYNDEVNVFCVPIRWKHCLKCFSIAINFITPIYMLCASFCARLDVAQLFAHLMLYHKYARKRSLLYKIVCIQLMQNYNTLLRVQIYVHWMSITHFVAPHYPVYVNIYPYTYSLKDSYSEQN